MGTTRFNSLDGFVNHNTRASSGKFLKGWKENGHIFVFLHTQQLPIGLWRHNFPTLVVREDRDTRRVERHIWGQSYNCHESEEILISQNFRDKATKKRDKMPERCPLCRLIEHVWQRVNVVGDISWVAPIFRFDGADDPRENSIIHAAGIYNAFTSNAAAKFTDGQKAELQAANIFPSEAWKENAKAGLNYVFTIVNAEKPTDGVMVTVEKQSLGDRVKNVINDALESMGVEAGNPTINPYCIEFIFNDSERDINKKYHARRIDRIALTPDIERLIRSEPPNIDQVLKPFSIQTFRAQVEKHLVVDLDLDWIFDVPDEEDSDDQFPPPDGGEESESAEDAPSGRVPEVNTKPEPKPEPAPEPAKAGGRKQKAAKEPEIPPEELGDPCDTCKAPMRKGQLKCEKCGTEYEADDEPAPAPQVKMKPCKHCKTPNPETAKNCSSCGKKLFPF